VKVQNFSGSKFLSCYDFGQESRNFTTCKISKAMAQKEIKLLEQQIERLGAKDFNLDSWKNYTLIILSKIFGNDNEMCKKIEQIDFKFNSWSLRDASGNESYEEGKKRQAKEILQAAIDQLNIFGLPKKEDNEFTETQIKDLLQFLLDELKGAQVKRLKNIISSNTSSEEKRRQVNELISEIGDNTAFDIFTNMLMHPAFSKFLAK
jgi:hypothetical protein